MLRTRAVGLREEEGWGEEYDGVSYNMAVGENLRSLGFVDVVWFSAEGWALRVELDVGEEG
jgi:hypothetical protein